ncbi:MAG: S41 family peptidase, partial [Desulfocucumaceae bacterium]
MHNNKPGRRKIAAHIFRTFLLSLALVQLMVFPAAALAAEETNGYLEETIRFVQEVYLEEVEADTLAQSSLRGLFNSLDPYTVFFTNKEADNFISGIEGVYVGIGAMMVAYGDFSVIYETLPDSPAAAAGLMPGDIITAVDGNSTVGYSLNWTLELIKGDVDTPVSLQIWRKAENKVFEIELTRASLKINPLEYSFIGH